MDSMSVKNASLSKVDGVNRPNAAKYNHIGLPNFEAASVSHKNDADQTKTTVRNGLFQKVDRPATAANYNHIGLPNFEEASVLHKIDDADRTKTTVQNELPQKVDRPPAARYNHIGLPNFEAASVFHKIDVADRAKTTVYNESPQTANRTIYIDISDDEEELDLRKQDEVSDRAESHQGVDQRHQDVVETQQVEVSNGIEEPDDPFIDPIKKERDAYPEYDTIKKEEPDDDLIDRKLPELGEINDMFDDVDAPEYVDLDYEGIAEVDGVDCFVCEEFKIRQVPKPVIVTRPLYQLFGQLFPQTQGFPHLTKQDCIVSGHIVLDSDYQRDVGWDEGRGALLISSILTGYFIPPIIFNCVEREVDGTEQKQHRRICIDGKQRLSSVWKFMTGQIGFFDSNKPQKKWYFCHPTEDIEHSNVERNILPNAVKEFFKNQSFCCYEYDELTQDTEETMFQLVQKGIALTPAEKMRAMSTEWATFTKNFEDMYPTVINLSRQNRASGFRLILIIFAMVKQVLAVQKVNIFTVPAVPYLQASTQALGKMLEDKRPIDNQLKLRLKSVFDKFETLVRLSSTELSTNRWKIDRNSAFDPSPFYLKSQDIDQARFTPLELVATAILITVHAETHSDEDLLEDIKWMRHHLRNSAKELRINSNCWKLTWQFISTELNHRRALPPAFVTSDMVRDALKRRETTANARTSHKPRPNAKSKSTSRITPQPSSSGSKSKLRRATPVQLGERLFPNLPPKAVVREESAGFNDDDDDDETLSEYSDLSELEEEIIRLGRPQKRSASSRNQSAEIEEGVLENAMSSNSSIVVEVRAYQESLKRARLS